MFVWVCKRRKGREMRWECVCVWACSLALTGVSFPGMNNSNECNGNHAMLVILFSVACPSAPPTPHITARAGKQAPRAAPCFSYLNCYISALFPVKKEGYQTEREHLSIHRSLVSSQPQHTHTHTSHVLYVFWPFYLARCVRTQLEVTLIGAVASLAGGIDRLRQ